MSDDRLQLSRVIAAPRERVFAAWLDPDTLRSFMCPRGAAVPLAEVEARVGGSFRIDMRHGDEIWAHTGTYLEISPPERLVFTWQSRATADIPSLVTLVFHEHAGGTELLLTQERLPSAHAVIQHTGGWAQILDLLGRHLAREAEPEQSESSRYVQRTKER